MRRRPRRGLVIGELLIAVLLLAVAVSTLVALMYSVPRRSTARVETECVASAAAKGKCVPDLVAVGGGPSKLLRSGCATRSAYAQRNCKDTVVNSDGSGGVVVKPRTDSTAMALLAKKEKEKPPRPERPDRGFIR